MSGHRVTCGQCSWFQEGNASVRDALAAHDRHYRDVHMVPAAEDPEVAA